MNMSIIIQILIISCSALSFGCSSTSRVKFISDQNKIDILIDGKLFTTYRHTPDPSVPLVAKGILQTKPVLWPVNSPSGIEVTRGFPFKLVEGENRDHSHHQGVYFTYDKVNYPDGTFWNNSTEPMPAIKHIKTLEMKTGNDKGILTTLSNWVGKSGKTLLQEKRSMLFYAEKEQYKIDFTIILTAQDEPVVFNDTKEGMFAIRVAQWLTEANGTGRYLSSNGEKTEAGVWGKRAKWTRLQGRKNNKTIGIAIYNHPLSVNYPTFWHARAYGCFSACPLGQFVFQQNRKIENPQPFNLTLKPGESATFKFCMIIYEGERTSDQLEKEFVDYVQGF